MEDLFGLLIVIIGFAVSIANKRKKKQAASRTPTITFSAASTSAPPITAAPVKTEQLKMPLEPELKPEPKAEARPAAVQPAKKKAEQAAKVLPKGPGSMLAKAAEGEDPCHEDQFEAMDKAAVSVMPVERPGLELDFSGDSMVKAVIMQEVLTRPCQRRRRA